MKPSLTRFEVANLAYERIETCEDTGLHHNPKRERGIWGEELFER
jgi:hypothetical protein